MRYTLFIQLSIDTISIDVGTDKEKATEAYHSVMSIFWWVTQDWLIELREEGEVIERSTSGI